MNIAINAAVGSVIFYEELRKGHVPKQLAAEMTVNFSRQLMDGLLGGNVSLSLPETAPKKIKWKEVFNIGLPRESDGAHCDFRKDSDSGVIKWHWQGNKKRAFDLSFDTIDSLFPGIVNREEAVLALMPWPLDILITDAASEKFVVVRTDA